MKRKAIIILILSMALIIIALIYFQVSYLNFNVYMLESRFQERVKKSLSLVADIIEENEALDYLLEEYESFSDHEKRDPLLRESVYNSILFSADSAMRAKSNRELNSQDPEKISKIEKVSLELQNRDQQNFSQLRVVLEQAVFRWLRLSREKKMIERISFSELAIVLENVLRDDSIDTPYHYSVVDKNGEELYVSIKYRANVKDNFEGQTVFTQRLFPRSLYVDPVFLQVVFPAKRNEMKTSLRLFMPSIAIGFLIFFIYIGAIIVILRQKQLSEMKTDFMNIMTHELKTPISTISLAAQMLGEQDVDKKSKRGSLALRVIQDETKRLTLQVEKVLQIAFFEKEDAVLNLSELSVNAVISDVVKVFSIKIANKGGQVITKLNAKSDIILADELHFTNVLFNLMDNALKYSDKPLVLVIETYNVKENIIITIEDNGIGIGKEDLKRVFDKFFRVSTGNRHDVKGFGIGLVYVYKMIKEHKGTIKVKSELQLGTKFIISIPKFKTDEL